MAAWPGSVVAEEELITASDSAQFVPPPWLGQEVTEDEAYEDVKLVLWSKPGDAGVVRGDSS